MKGIFFCFLALAVLSSGSLATASLKKKNQKVILAQQDKQVIGYSLQDLLELDVSNIPCTDARFYQQLSYRIDDIVQFLSNDPEEDIKIAISTLKQVKILLKKVQEGIKEIEELAQPNQPVMMQIQDKHDKIRYRLNKINSILFASIFRQLTEDLSQSQNGNLEVSKKLIAKAIGIVEQLEQKFQELSDNSSNFPEYVQELQAKSASISEQLAACNNSNTSE